ncbi:MAG TPA: response regulator transcription factor [Solirubrobacterales bacterium]|jgi:DNA-binding NarL/FixJ family response regulator
MQAEAKSTGNSPRPAARPSVVAVVAGAELRRRIVAALAEAGLELSAKVDSAADAPGLEPDESTVIVFACDVDAPREMASLRRLCREAPEPAVVLISAPATGPGVRRALDAGASGLVFESELELTLGTAVWAVASGQSVVPRKLRAGVENPVLSHRERQVLGLVRKGLTNAQIAEHLFLAESTVKSHLASIFTKFGVRSRKEVTAVLVDMEGASLVPAGSSGSAGQATT